MLVVLVLIPGMRCQGLMVLSSLGLGLGACAGGGCAPNCITNFLLFTVIGCTISMLTLFLFNLAFAAAAVCSRVMDFTFVPVGLGERT